MFVAFYEAIPRYLYLKSYWLLFRISQVSLIGLESYFLVVNTFTFVKVKQPNLENMIRLISSLAIPRYSYYI